MKNKRALTIGGTVMATVVVALLVIPSFIDWSQYQSMAKQKVQDATGYDLTINGALRVGLLPTPHASVSDVVMKKPVAGKEDAFLSFKNADVRIALLPLLTGKVEVASVTLESPTVTLVTYKDGTDNYTPKAKATTETQEGSAQAAPTTDDQGTDVKIDGLRIKDGRFVLRNEKTGTTQNVGINDLSISADTLTGPFEGEGTIAYGQAEFDVDITTGGYRAGQTLPVQLNVKDSDDRMTLKWSGVVATGNAPEIQGETTLSFGDIGGLLNDVGIAASVPSLGDRTVLSGMLTASASHVTLTNGTVQLGKTKFQTKFDVTGLDKDAMAISASLDTNEVLDLDALKKVADKISASTPSKEAPKKAASKQASTQPLLAEDFAIPANLTGDVQIRARGLRYNKGETGAFDARLSAAGGKGDVRATIDSIPGGGNISISASTQKKGAVSGALIASVDSLKGTLSDWLAVVDASVLEGPGMPRRLDADIDFALSGYTASANLKTLSLGEPKITGSVSYTQSARPVINAKLNVNVLTLPGSAAKNKPASGNAPAATSSAPKKIDVNFDPPQLPFDVKFDVALGRLVKDDFILSDVKAAGAYNSKGIMLSNLSANMNGGTVSASGSIADLKAISGVDMKAGLRTADLEGFVKAVSGTALDLPQKIGDFNGTIKAKGDRNKMAVDADLQARGFTVSAAGTLNDPFSPELPGALSVRVRHPNMVNAIRTFSPGFGDSSSAPKPIDMAGNVKISGKVYALNDLKGVIGTSDIAGSIKADMSGAVPNIIADITSKKLDIGALVGVESKATSAASAAGGAQTVSASSGSGQWSREQLDTSFLKAMSLDVKMNAGSLLYGTWVLKDAKAGLVMKNGALTASPISGKLFDGAFDATLKADSAGKGQPLNFAFNADVNNVAIGPFLQALMSSSAKRADGTGSVKVDMKGSGISTAALMASLSGKTDISTKTLTVYGMDIDKLAANIVEAFDGGWKGVLSGFALQGFSGGQTTFKDVDQTLPISGGDMAFKNFQMETTSGNAILNTNGTVSFSRWNMDLQSDVRVSQPKDVPVIGVRLSGPLNAPSKAVNSQALDNLLRSKVTNKVQDVLGDKLKDSKAGDIINQFVPGLLGGSQTQQQAPVQENAPSQETVPAQETAPAPTTQTAPQKSQEQQVLEGVMGILGR